VQLIDAVTGHHIWAEKYDRDLKDIFEIQDEIAVRIIRALAVELTEGDQFRTRLNRPGNIEAFIKLLKAYESYRQHNKEGNAHARKLIEESIELDPQHPESYLLMALTYQEDIYYGSESPLYSFAQATKYLKKAMALDNNNSDAFIVLSLLNTLKRDHDEAIAAAKQAITLNPSAADAYFGLGSAFFWASKPAEAIEYLKKAIRLNPMPPSYYFLILGHCYRGLERFEEALGFYEKAVEVAPNSVFAHLGFAVTYIYMGREQEARTSALKVLRIDPDFSVNAIKKASPSKDRKGLKRFYEAARKAGLPD
jgi:adenylate cyclase